MARCLTLLQTKIIFSEYLFCYCQKDFDMDARNNLKIIHTVDGAILQNRYGKAVIRSHDIGLISLPTGEIVMADPTLRFEIADFKRKAFQQKGSPGIYDFMRADDVGAFGKRELEKRGGFKNPLLRDCMDTVGLGEALLEQQGYRLNVSETAYIRRNDREFQYLRMPAPPRHDWDMTM